ncbi:MAG: MaoC family dehydratase N-terminal domain-containing protein [Chloroflexi bacterium]|nr:MaoC family dehydratase N-terminal domain-containing protein [Chloroflexota bacterium]
MALITEDLKRQALAVEPTSTTIDIDKSILVRFLDAVEDKNPRWLGTEGRNREMTVTPALFLSSFMASPRPELPFELEVKDVLDGGGEWEYFMQTRVGDTLTAQTRFIDVYERQGNAGTLVFAVRETVWKNKKGQVVAKAKTTTVIR